MLIHLFMLIILTLTLILCQTVINIQSKDFCPSKTGSTKNRIPRLQIRTVLVRCPNRGGEFHVVKGGASDSINMSATRTQDLMEFYGYDTDEPLLHSEVTNCRRKLVVTIQITNCGKTKTEEEFILIDQVYDPVWKHRIRLLNPVVFKIKQRQVEQSYGLIIQHIVNAEASEQVINKNNKSFLGCSASGLNPTCGYSYYHHEVIPYSEGFCCSCDPYINVMRQPDTLRIPPMSPIAFTTREGNYPQGIQTKKQKSRVKKRKTERTFKDSIDEIYESFASKIKSYMYPEHRRMSELKSSDHPTRFRSSRGLFRMSPKYYQFPPLNPARGFKYSDAQRKSFPNFDPWAITYTLNATQKEKLENSSCTSFSRILTKYTPDKRVIRSWEWEPELLDELLEPDILEELLEQKLLSNESCMSLLRDMLPIEKRSLFTYHFGNDRSTAESHMLPQQVNITLDQAKKYLSMLRNLLPNEKRSVYTHYYDPGRADSKLLAQPLNMPLSKGEKNPMEHFVTMVKMSNESDWINHLINPYLDLGANCRYNITREFPPLAFEATTLSAPHKRNHTKKIKTLRKPLRKPRIRRQITSSGTQVRGGQSCLDRHTPMRADPETYHESAHCLVFSELWYNVYRLKTPFISHSTTFRLFDKNTFEAGHSHWEDLTKGMHINIGTFNRHIVNHKDDPTLVFTYTPLSDIRPDQFCLDPQKTTLLIPRPLPKESVREFPQILGGPEEYLLVRSEDITYDGDDCDKAGVGFKAFAKQSARCDNLRGTCLGNQPAHLWKQDIEARRSGKPGKYFLENYAKVSEDPIKFHKEVGDFLSLDFTGPYQSVVEVEVPIDRNGLVRAESTAQLSEIYIDATCEHQTRITILVTNNGLTSSAFYPRMKGCPPEIPMVWTENEGPLVYIAPQKIHKYRLSLYGKLPATRFHCSIELMNKKKELVATRRIRVQHYDRCICMWHCLCACIGSISGLKCEHMSLEHYHAAGFFGAMPIDTEDPAYERADGVISPFILKDFLIYVGYVYATFIIMGLLKFLLGLFFVTIANYGMWLLFECEAKEMKNYKESYWAFTHLVKDSESFPISPAGRSRQIQILSKTAQAFVNILFFCILPGIVLLKLPCAFCNVLSMSCTLLKIELLKTEWIRKCCSLPCCKILTRCLRRTNKACRKNFWLPLCCFMNPFFLYSLCRSKKKIESSESKEKQPVKAIKKCKMHFRVLPKENVAEEDGPPTVQYFEYMASTQHGNIDEDKLLLSSENNPLRKDYKMSNKIPFSVDDMLPNNYEDIIANVTYIVKASDYPNLDKKTIKYVVKNVKKGFNNVMDQVIKAYKAHKHNQDVRALIKEVEEMKNKMMKTVISNVSKTAIQKILKNKYGMKENSEHEKSAVKPIAEQVVVLVDRCFKEIIKRKTDEARLAKLYDGDIKPMDNLIANHTFDQNLQFQSGNKNRYFGKPILKNMS